MNKWRLVLFGLFLFFGLVSSGFILRPTNSHPATLADVTNWASIVSPIPSSTPTPTTTPGPSPTPTATTPTLGPSSTLTPTPRATVTPTLIPSPTPSIWPSATIIPSPTIIAYLTPTPIVPPTPIEEPEQYFSYSLFGYTSSYANVRLEGIKLLEGTKANQNGYFEFIDFKASNRNQEFCLLSVDTENLVTPPLCVPVPIAQISQKYGPYLLPPTLKLAKGDIKTGENSQISGRTIPGASVNINVFNQAEKPLAKIIAKPVFAQSTNNQPEVFKLKTSADGSFKSDLTGTSAGKKRVFAQSVFSLEKIDSKTPKSVTLTLNVFGIFIAILIELFNLFSKLLNLNSVLLLQLGLVIYLIILRKRLFNWYYLYHHKKTAIVLYRQRSLAKAIKNYCPL